MNEWVVASCPKEIASCAIFFAKRNHWLKTKKQQHKIVQIVLCQPGLVKQQSSLFFSNAAFHAICELWVFVGHLRHANVLIHRVARSIPISLWKEKARPGSLFRPILPHTRPLGRSKWVAWLKFIQSTQSLAVFSPSIQRAQCEALKLHLRQLGKADFYHRCSVATQFQHRVHWISFDTTTFEQFVFFFKIYRWIPSRGKEQFGGLAILCQRTNVMKNDQTLLFLHRSRQKPTFVSLFAEQEHFARILSLHCFETLWSPLSTKYCISALSSFCIFVTPPHTQMKIHFQQLQLQHRRDV